MLRWENDSWKTVNLPVTQDKSISGIIIHRALFNIDKAGTFDIHVECEGLMNVQDKQETDEFDEWKGIITYEPQDPGFEVDAYGGAILSDVVSTSSLTKGHKDASMNGATFSQQIIERDWTASFTLKCEKACQFGLAFPPIRTDQHYNFVVSYGGYTWKTMEYGTISIVIDEIGQDSRSNMIPRSPYGGRLWGKKTPRMPSQQTPGDLYPVDASSSGDEA